MPWQLLPEFPPNARAGGTCSVCNSDLRPYRAGGHERALDTGIWIDQEGRLVICESCVREAATLIGLVPPGRSDALRGTLLRVEAENRSLKAALDIANGLLEGMARYQPLPEGLHHSDVRIMDAE